MPGPTQSPPSSLSPELDRALRNATEVRIRTVVDLLCQSDIYVRGKVSDLLLIEDKQSTTETAEGSRSGSSTSGKKRQRYEVCEQCDKEFQATENTASSCRWHSGEKLAYYDDDFWADHDEQCHGDIDGFVDDETYQEGFQWDCCDKQGDAEGCEVSKHTASVAEPKRHRLA